VKQSGISLLTYVVAGLAIVATASGILPHSVRLTAPSSHSAGKPSWLSDLASLLLGGLDHDVIHSSDH
jgi:hypothetical protein